MSKVICYANLNCFNSSDMITDEHMKRYFGSIINTEEHELVGVVIDRYNPEIYYDKRDGWKEVVSACESGAADMIMVPALSMVSPCLVDIASLIKELQFKYSSSIYFIRENICSAESDVQLKLQFHATMEDHLDGIKKFERKMRKEFFAVNEIDGEISAVPVLIDNKQYEKVEKFGRDFGIDAQGLIRWFYDTVIDPDNYELFEQMLDKENIEENRWNLTGN